MFACFFFPRFSKLYLNYKLFDISYNFLVDFMVKVRMVIRKVLTEYYRQFGVEGALRLCQHHQYVY